MKRDYQTYMYMFLLNPEKMKEDKHISLPFLLTREVSLILILKTLTEQKASDLTPPLPCSKNKYRCSYFNESRGQQEDIRGRE